MLCPACQNEIPTDSRFCGMCGFRLYPISKEQHRSLSQELAAMPLANRKVDPEGQLEVVAQEPRDVGLDDTLPRSGQPRVRIMDGLEDTSRRDQRDCKRFPLRVEVSYTSEHNFYTGFMQNLSSGGLFVATHEPVTIGETLEVTFTVPGLERICTGLCEVRWTRDHNPDAPDTIAGMGLNFTNLEPEVQAAIELFIRHREPIFFDDDEW